MFKQISQNVWAFDVEWVPDTEAGRRLYQLPEHTPDAEVIQKMWKEAGADEETLIPYLKTTICRVISIAAVVRSEKGNGEVALSLTALLLEKDPCRQARFLFDVCESGSVAKAFARIQKDTGGHILYAAASNQLATEFDSLGHGIFTYTLLKTCLAAHLGHDCTHLLGLLKTRKLRHLSDKFGILHRRHRILVLHLGNQ